MHVSGVVPDQAFSFSDCPNTRYTGVVGMVAGGGCGIGGDDCDGVVANPNIFAACPNDGKNVIMRTMGGCLFLI